jgi:hypothetical protein
MEPALNELESALKQLFEQPNSASKSQIGKLREPVIILANTAIVEQYLNQIKTLPNSLQLGQQYLTTSNNQYVPSLLYKFYSPLIKICSLVCTFHL